MKGKYLPFLILPVLFLIFLLVNPLGVDARGRRRGRDKGEIVPIEDEYEWEDTSLCIPTVCDSTLGTKTQAVFEEVCEQGCPTESFSTSREVCPRFYNEHQGRCRRRNIQGNWVYADKITEPFGPIDVVYGLRSQDPNKCHRPTARSLELPTWVIPIYNTTVSEHLDFIDINCVMETVMTRTVDCDDAIPFACEDETPVVDDEPAVEGVTDEVVEEVKAATTQVVLAETGASDNILVYIVQTVLMLSTLVSGTLFVKKYII